MLMTASLNTRSWARKCSGTVASGILDLRYSGLVTNTTSKHSRMSSETSYVDGCRKSLSSPAVGILHSMRTDAEREELTRIAELALTIMQSCGCIPTAEQGRGGKTLLVSNLQESTQKQRRRTAKA